MSGNYSSKRISCPDFFQIHKKVVYKKNSLQFKQLGDLAIDLAQLYPDLKILPSTNVCNNCHKRMSSMILNDLDYASDDEIIEFSSGKDDDFIPKSPERIRELNEGIHTILPGCVSPLKRKTIIRENSMENYVSKKKKSLISAFSATIGSQLKNAYGIPVEPTESSESSTENYWNEFIENFKSALEKCSSISEKIKLLTLLPSNLSRTKICSLFPNISEYMVDKSRNLVKNHGVYSEPDAYTGHPIEEETKNIAMEYFLNDDYNCSRQSPNKSDVVTVKVNNTKTKKVRRFLTRSLKETYSQLKIENPKLQIGKSKFYSLRPSFVLTSPVKEACLCVYCENYELFLTSLIRYRGDSNSELNSIRSEITKAILCSKQSDSCFLQECKDCPGIEGITSELLRLKTNCEDEITFALWDTGNLIKQTVSLSIFQEKLSICALKANGHIYIKNIQREAIKKEKEESKADPTKLLIHVDFAENWAVINNKAVQGNHWVNKQISIFTAVCYQGERTQSFAIVSDDKKHDTAYALLAIKKIINLMEKDFPVTKVTIISDGAPSQFKNRFQLYEFKHFPYEMKWLFSATGHGKGAVDGIGGLLKHYATSHNMKRIHEESIQNADDFVNLVQNCTISIKIILLPLNEIEKFREEKNIEWHGVPKYNGIQKSHMWLKQVGKFKSHVFIGRTAVHSLNEVKDKKKKDKRCRAVYKTKNNKRKNKKK